MSSTKAQRPTVRDPQGRRARALLLTSVLLGLLSAPPSVRALIRFDERRNEIFVTAGYSTSFSSNIDASSGGASDTMSSATFTAEYVRRAGLITLDSSLSLNATFYQENDSENFRDPSLKAEFSKRTGRTTGSLTLGAARESRADTAANLRNESWTYDVALDAKYPMLGGTYAFIGAVGANVRDFADNNALADQKGFTSSLDFYYVLNERSILGGYRFRRDATSFDSGNHDHAFTLGMSGPLLFRLNGTLRAGYQFRTPFGGTAGSRDTHTGWTANGSGTWEVTKRLDFAGQLSRDFSTTSTNISVDTLGGSVRGQYRLNVRTSFIASTSLNRTRFLDSVAGNRIDTGWSWDLTANRSLFDEHIKLSLSYSYFRNWSSSSFSSFDRRTLSFSASARY